MFSLRTLIEPDIELPSALVDYDDVGLSGDTMTSMSNDGKVRFAFHRRGASKVQVRVTPRAFLHGIQQTVIEDAPVNAEMECDGNGLWSLTLRLCAGEYSFEYLADGVVYSDFAGFGVEFRNGKWISLLSMPEPVAQQPLKLPHTAPVRLAA